MHVKVMLQEPIFNTTLYHNAPQVIFVEQEPGLKRCGQCCVKNRLVGHTVAHRCLDKVALKVVSCNIKIGSRNKTKKPALAIDTKHL